MKKTNSTKNILEIGCGQGFVTYCLSRDKRNKVVGIDISKEDIVIARKRYPNLPFYRMDASGLRFKQSTFDEIYAIDILEHVDNLKSVIVQITKVLKKGGKLIMNVPAEKSEYWLLRVRPTYFKEIHHVRVFKGNELEKLLEKYQFTLKEKKFSGFLQHVELFYLFKRKQKSNTQLGIGNWRDTPITMLIHISMIFLDPSILHVPISLLPRWMFLPLPVWFFTFPIGFAINSIGNRILPKSVYYEFKKNNS